MRKTICFLISMLIMMTSACIFAGASNENVYVINGDEYTVQFEDNVPAEKQEIIAQTLIVGEDTTVQTYGLGCTLFGHDYAYTTATVVQHKIFPNSPRCVKRTYDVTYCEDCDYTEETLIATTYIHCCPED